MSTRIGLRIELVAQTDQPPRGTSTDVVSACGEVARSPAAWNTSRAYVHGAGSSPGLLGLHSPGLADAFTDLDELDARSAWGQFTTAHLPAGARTMSNRARVHVSARTCPSGVGVPAGWSANSRMSESLTPNTESRSR